MAVGTAIEAQSYTHDLQKTTPVSLTSAWLTLHNAPATADDATLTKIADLDSTSIPLNIAGKGTKLMLRLRYDDGATPSTDPIIKVFLKDMDGSYHFGVDASGSSEITLTTDSAADFEDGTYKYSAPVEIDADASIVAIIGVQTAFAVSGGATTGSLIQARVK